MRPIRAWITAPATTGGSRCGGTSECANLPLSGLLRGRGRSATDYLLNGLFAHGLSMSRFEEPASQICIAVRHPDWKHTGYHPWPDDGSSWVISAYSGSGGHRPRYSQRWLELRLRRWARQVVSLNRPSRRRCRACTTRSGCSVTREHNRERGAVRAWPCGGTSRTPTCPQTAPGTTGASARLSMRTISLRSPRCLSSRGQTRWRIAP